MTITRYQFDSSGVKGTNKVLDMPFTFTATSVHVIHLLEGLFYTKGLVLKNQLTGQELVEDLDFEFIGFDSDITAQTGLEAAAGITITNSTFAGTLTLTCQLVGGIEGLSSALVEDLNRLITEAKDNPSIDWVAIKNKPSRFPAALHTHALSTLSDLDKVYKEFSGLKAALKDRRPSYASLSNVLEQQERTIMLLGSFRKSLNSLVAITGSTQQISDMQDTIDNLSGKVDVVGSGLQGFNKTLGVWDTGSFNRISAMIVFNDTDKTHSVMVDIAHAGGITQWTRTNEMKTQGTMFTVDVSETAGKVRLEIKPLFNGDYSVKWLAVI